jgi:hypothetical protein
MSESRFSLNLDSAAGLVTSTLILGIALTIFMGSQVGVRVTLELPPGDMVGPFETLTLEFSEPVDESLVIEKFFIQPEVQGKFEWSESKTMRFVPTQPFELDKEYTLVIAPGL